jgi:hypothetical protein
LLPADWFSDDPVIRVYDLIWELAQRHVTIRALRSDLSIKPCNLAGRPAELVGQNDQKVLPDEQQYH